MNEPDVLPVPAPLRLVLPLVALGGALGSVARYGLSLALPALPATVVINLLGALALALLAGLRPYGRWSRPFLGTGVLGGFTTFSTFAVQAVRADATTSLLYVAVTVVGGLAAAWLGLRATSRSAPRSAR